MKYLLDLSYDGSKYYGFQRQKSKPSIQEELEKVLSKVTKEKIELKGAGRTDRGVHAYHQMAHFETKFEVDPYKFRKIINDRLSDYIFVNKCSIVNNDFHARFDVKKKVYVYKINLGEYNPILNDYLYNLNHSLNIQRMKEFSNLLLGEHSYKYFVSQKRDNYDSALYDIIFKQEDDILEISFVGKHFYTYMVRNLMGFLIAVGKGIYQEDDIQLIFNDQYKSIKYTCVPANGLYLKSVEY